MIVMGDGFLYCTLHEMLTDKETCHIIFQTVEKIRYGGHSSTPKRDIETGHENLTIEIQEGIGWMEKKLLADRLTKEQKRAFDAGHIRWIQPDLYKKSDLYKKTECLAREHAEVLDQTEKPVILVKFVSGFAFDAEIEKLKRIISQNSNLEIVIVISNHNMREDLKILRPFHNSELISHINVTFDHDGSIYLGEILKTAIKIWEEK